MLGIVKATKTTIMSQPFTHRMSPAGRNMMIPRKRRKTTPDQMDWRSPAIAACCSSGISSNLLAPNYSLENGLPSHSSNGPPVYVRSAAVLDHVPTAGSTLRSRRTPLGPGCSDHLRRNGVLDGLLVLPPPPLELRGGEIS